MELFIGMVFGAGVALAIVIGVGGICYNIAVDAMAEIAERRWHEDYDRKEAFKDYFHG